MGVCQRDVTQHFPQLAELDTDREQSLDDNSCLRHRDSSDCSHVKDQGRGESGRDGSNLSERSGAEGAREEAGSLDLSEEDGQHNVMRPGAEARAALRALIAFHARVVRRRFPLEHCEWDGWCDS